VSDIPSCQIRLQPDSVRRGIEPFTAGVALPRGWCRDLAALRLIAPEYPPIPLQTRALERWSDGSVRWVLLDFQTSVEETPRLELGLGDVDPAPIRDPLILRTSASGTTVATGDTMFTFAAGTASPFASVHARGRSALDTARTRFVVQAADGRDWPVGFDRVDVEQVGPLRVAIAK
jgi:hypothetical protein